jgi:hypothetical protein
MTCMNASNARIGFVTLAVTILTVGICGEAVAKAGKGRLHVPGLVAESRAKESADSVQPVPQQAQLGPMRYYGGPKSPMWRGPAVN